MNSEILREWTDPKTNWTVREERHFDSSVLPLWKRLLLYIQEWPNNGAQFSIQMMWGELWARTDQGTEMISYYSQIDGGYIGGQKTAEFLFNLGIQPELGPNRNTCCIGWNEDEQEWWGWSHRAICEFGIGDRVEEGNCCATSGWSDEYLEEHPEADNRLPVGFVAKSNDDAKLMAIAYASSVG